VQSERAMNERRFKNAETNDRARHRTLALGAAFAVAACNVAAQTYPSRPIRFVVPQSAGSATDLVAREIGNKLSERLGQPVTIDNRAGAGGIIGMEVVAKAPPDGHTIGIVSGTHTVNPSIRRNMPYDAIKDFAPVTLATSQPYLLVAHPSLPVKNVKELVALARARPGQINFASSGTGTLGHLGIELLKLTAHIDMVHIPYKGIVPALTDLMGGHVSLLFPTLVSGLPQAKAGRLTALAVSTGKRAAIAPDIPTVAESGFPGYDVSGWFGILAPAGTPAAIVSRLNGEIVAILQMNDVKEKLAADGSTTVGSTPQQFDAHLKAEMAKWAQVVKAAHIRAE
jgi:tripartite-type tricarboxylate transporter receptor subunit TctC